MNKPRDLRYGKFNSRIERGRNELVKVEKKRKNAAG
jgi:hypothetical protein